MTIIGISQHTILGPLEDTIEELGINYLVAEDSDMDTWDAYGMRAHPSWAFINPDGSMEARAVGKVINEQALELIQQSLGG